MKKLIGIKELSERIGMPIKTIYFWTSIKTIPFHTIGRRIKFDEDEIGQWLKGRKIDPSK